MVWKIKGKRVGSSKLKAESSKSKKSRLKIQGYGFKIADSRLKAFGVAQRYGVTRILSMRTHQV